MTQNLEFNRLEEFSMDSFKDVPLDSRDSSTENITYRAQDHTRPVNNLADDLKVQDTQPTLPITKTFRVPSEGAYQQAFLPLHTNTGTPYPCNQTDLDIHNTTTFPHPNTHPFVSPMTATQEIMLHNHITRRVPPSELLAIDTLTTTIAALEKRMRFNPDLAIKAFADLDLLFFGGRLRNHVRVRWVRASSHARFASAPQRVWAVAIHLSKQRGKCLIKLNADALLLLRHKDNEEDPLRFIFGTLLHEMCHAYHIVRCGYGKGQKRRGHDEFFSTRIAVVHQRARRVLGLWAIGKGELYRQFHFFEGERTRMGMVGGWVLDVVLDVEDMVQEKMDRVAERAVVGVEAVKRWMLAEDEGVE